jgi:hypothetical protein
MQKNREIFESEAEEKRAWYKLSYEEAIFAGYEEYKKAEEKLKRTTIMMPQTMRIEIEQLKAVWDYPQRYLIYQLVYHGHSILEYHYKREIRAIKKLRDAMGHPKIGRICDFIYDMRTTINGLSKPKQREVRVSSKILSSFSEMSSALGIEQSSLMRLCAYYSIVTYPDLSREIRDMALKEIVKFGRYVEESEVLYEGFKVAEEKMAMKRKVLKEGEDLK